MQSQPHKHPVYYPTQSVDQLYKREISGHFKVFLLYIPIYLCKLKLYTSYYSMCGISHLME